MKNKFFALLLVMCMVIGILPMSALAEEMTPVAKVGNTEYATIDEAIAAWTDNTPLTLLADVTLSDVITLKSTGHHILNLGTYTMTAASGKNAIEITCEGRSSASYALTINADADDPGGITATGNACIYYKKNASTKDRPIIVINNGVFNGSYSINSSSSNKGTNCPQYWINGGTFNAYMNLTNAMLITRGGYFNCSINCTGDVSAYRQISGGTFKNWQFMTTGPSGIEYKFNVGSAKNVFDVGVYVDSNGYLVVGGPIITEPGTTFAASSTNYSGWSSYLQYSSAAENGLYYTSVEEALADNNKTTGKVTVYVDELDLTGSSFKGTLLLPNENSDLTVTFPEGTTPAWSADTEVDGKTVVYEDSVNNGVVTRNYLLVNAYDVTVVANPAEGGSVVGGGTYAANTEVTIEATADDDFYFVNWTDANNTAVSTNTTHSFSLSTNCEFTANFAAKTAEATPNAAFTAPNKLTGLDANAEYSITVEQTSDEYEANENGEIIFDETWYGKTISIVKIAQDNTYKNSAAQELPIDARVIYDTNTTPNDNVTKYVAVGETVPAYGNSDPTRTGYSFDGWYTDKACSGNAWDFSTDTVTESMTLYAKWVANAFTVTFDFNDDVSAPIEEPIYYDGFVSAPTDPTREGYAFVEWQLNGTKYDFDTPVTGDITLTALWAKTWNVTYDYGYDDIIDTETVLEGDTATYFEPTRDGYIFDGWYNRFGWEFDFTKPIDHDITLYAYWTREKQPEVVIYMPVSVETTENGSIDLRDDEGAVSHIVYFDVDPDKGYTVEDVWAVDAEGNNVRVTREDSDTYSFRMPNSAVTIGASFKKVLSYNPFADVVKGEYYYDAVLWAVDNGITTGVDGLFLPYNDCTRGQFVTFLWRAAGCPAPQSASSAFVDVDPSAYYYNAMLWAVENGITTGMSAETFNPDGIVDRGQVVTFLYRYAGAPRVNGGESFVDVDPASYCAAAVQWAVNNGITQGTSAEAKTFNPLDSCTRGQVVTFLYRFFG